MTSSEIALTNHMANLSKPNSKHTSALFNPFRSYDKEGCNIQQPNSNSEVPFKNKINMAFDYHKCICMEKQSSKQI